jgi:hypothetical protein
MPIEDLPLIREKIQFLNKRKNKLLAQIDKIQTECSHPFVTKVHRSNTGNYDPSTDCYWDECSCPDCGKYWTQPQ